jgi:hypothetical protein
MAGTTRDRSACNAAAARAAQARGLVAGTNLGMLMLRSYLLISVLLLVVKAVQLRGG